MAGSLAANALRAAYQHQNRGMGFTLHSTLTLPWTAWRRVVSLTHGMTNSLTQQQMCYRMVGQEKCATRNKSQLGVIKKIGKPQEYHKFDE
jgi:hypothetical protein